MAWARRSSGKGRLGAGHASLHDLVRKEIRAAIVEGRLKPGDRLVEDRLAEEFGVSRNPVREAIRALSSEGLVDVSSRRGAYVAHSDMQEVREAIEIRALLEAHNARLAARHRTPQVLKRAHAILEKGQAAIGAGRGKSLNELNDQFHNALAEAGSNRLLSEVLSMLRVRSALLFSPADPERQKQNWDEHASILKAIIEGDEDRAARLAMEHVIGAGEAQLSGEGVRNGEG